MGLVDKVKLEMNPTFIAIFALCAITLAGADEYMSCLKKAGDTCRMKLSLEEDIYKEFMSGRSMPQEERIKCFSSCLIRQLGFYQDGSYNEEAVRKMVTRRYKDPMMQDKAMRAMRTCGEQINLEDKDCELASTMVDCVVKEAQKDNIDSPFMLPN